MEMEIESFWSNEDKFDKLIRLFGFPENYMREKTQELEYFYQNQIEISLANSNFFRYQFHFSAVFIKRDFPESVENIYHVLQFLRNNNVPRLVPTVKNIKQKIITTRGGRTLVVRLVPKSQK